jgi:hypothetical protein
MKRSGTCTCLHCGAAFTPDPRNARRQKYCPAPDCKAASKYASQAKWLAAPANQDYHRSAEAVARVKAWRQANPGYSRRRSTPKSPLPDVLPDQMPAIAQHSEPAERPDPAPPLAIPTPQQIETAPLQEPLQERIPTPVEVPVQISCNASVPAEISAQTPLQDIWTAQPYVLIGLIAHLWDSPLQDVIAPAVVRLYQLGFDIRGGQHDHR